jgi:pyruvate carboxylase
VKFLAVGDPHNDGTRTVFFELNGQPRQVTVRDLSLKVETREHPKALTSDPNQIGAPTPGLITGLFVQAGDDVKRNDKLLSLEAMKMQSTIYALKDGKIVKVLVEAGQQVEAKDLLLVME